MDDDAVVTALEAAIADAGALVVRAGRYRRGAAPEGAGLLREALALGDAARRLHRADALDPTTARPLLDAAQALAGRLRALLAAVRDAPEYRAAVAAHAAGDAATLVRLLPGVFTGLEAADVPGDLFHVVAWLRRGRPRPAPDIVAEIVDIRDLGLPAEGDDLTPGADAELPAVVLLAQAPVAEPIMVCVRASRVPGPLHRLVDTGEFLVHAARLRVPFVVRLAAAPPGDEQLRVELPAAEFGRYRAELAAALAGAGISVDDG